MPTLSDPTPPLELLDACVAGECVLYAGAGLSAQAGFPTWQPFIRELVNWALRQHFIDEADADAHGAATEEGRSDLVADGIVSAVGNNRTPLLYKHLRKVFLRGQASELLLPKCHTLLANIPFAAALTTNFDLLLEQTFSNRDANVFTPRDTDPLLEALHRRAFFILKLYGRLDQTESVMLAPAQVEDFTRDNRGFAQFMETLFFSRTLLFLGASLEGIENYLRGIALPRLASSRSHFALIAATGSASWRAKAEALERRFSIKVIPYYPDPGHTEVLQFVEELRSNVALAQGRARLDQTSGSGSQASVGKLKKIALENIGPFERLELELDPKWNVLLGNNGVGKSSILRAIALALCGREAEQYASRLVKAGATRGSIVLQTEKETYRTDILLTPEGAELQSTSTRALEAEGWLAIGFPPLRMVTWSRPRSPAAREVRSRPNAADLLPLVESAIDPRMDGLKQWIVNLDYWSKDDRLKKNTHGRYEALLNELFRVIGILAGGLRIERGEVNPQTYEVTIVTDDGPVPLELASQGTTSLIGWVGILLQRLYEVYGSDAEPRESYALVLIDEIDAHLHPAWQQSLVQRLSDLFPNMQFIATTHSPLLVGGMAPAQIIRFTRADGKIKRVKVAADMTMGRTDQVLTSDLFGLETTLDPVTQTQVERYQVLRAMPTRTAKEEREYLELDQSLPFRVPVPEPNYEERRVKMLTDALLLKEIGTRFKDEFPTGSEVIISRADRLLSEFEETSRNAAEAIRPTEA